MKKRLLRIIGLISLLFVLAACSDTTSNNRTPNSGPTQLSALPTMQGNGKFNEYPLPQGRSGIMRPAIDHQQRIWFGEMGRNLLGYFDPASKTFHQFNVPDGQGGIMGIAVAADDTIWYAEQNANYIGHYDPRSNHFSSYALSQVTAPNGENNKTTIKLPVGPNELAIDQQGNIWFTEMNADAIAKLDPHSSKITQYPLSEPRTIQQLNPYGITIDKDGLVWFTEAGKGTIGRIDPKTGGLRTYSEPKAGPSFMEIANDASGRLWLTAFNNSILVQFDPRSDIFTAYPAATNDNGVSGIYGVLVTPNQTIWLTIPAANAIARFDQRAKAFVYYAIPTANSTPLGIAIDQHNALWFTESATDQLSVLKPQS
jgi:virginiamycin B lyase